MIGAEKMVGQERYIKENHMVIQMVVEAALTTNGIIMGLMLLVLGLGGQPKIPLPQALTHKVEVGRTIICNHSVLQFVGIGLHDRFNLIIGRR
jgi:hypothetical protein